MEVGKAVEQLWPGKSLSCTPNVPYPDGFVFFFFSYLCCLPTYYNIYLFYCLSLLARMAAT